MTERRAGFGSPFCDSHCSENTTQLSFSLNLLLFLKKSQNKTRFIFTKTARLNCAKSVAKKTFHFT